MRFRVTEFEQHFSESNLEKGLRLLRRTKPVLQERHGPHLGYMIGGHLVSLQQNQMEIDHCFCDCKRKFCPHAAALMFFFLERSIGSQQSTRLRRKKVVPEGEDKFSLSFNGLKETWKSISKEPGQHGVRRFIARLQDMSAKGDFVTDMAIIASMSLLGRTAITNDILRELTNSIIVRHFKGNFRVDEGVLYQCLLETVRTTERAASSQFSGILPLYLVLTSNMFRLEELRVTLEKRNQKKFHADIFDELLVARTMVFFRCSQVQGGEIKLLKNSPPESFVALARLHFAKQEIDQAWKVIEELRKQMRESALGYFDFLVYLISLSEALCDTHRQIVYLEELILHSPYLSTLLAKKYYNMLPQATRKEKMNELMGRVAETGAEGSVDKVFVLAGVSGQSAMFLQLCQKQKVKFHMLHELLINKLVHNSADEIAYYFKRLKEALVQTDFYQARVLLLEMAAAFLEKVDGHEAARHAGETLDFISGYPLLHNLQNRWIEMSESKVPQFRF
jgi:hypothetical protein